MVVMLAIVDISSITQIGSPKHLSLDGLAAESVIGCRGARVRSREQLNKADV
jgi:hypothetical protein